MSKSLGLALGSGGARGIAHIGFLQALEENGIKPQYISGCSMGAIVGGCYACGVPLEKIKERAFALKLRELLEFSPRPISRLGLLKQNKVHNLLEELVGKTKIEDTKIPFSCVAVDLKTGDVVNFKTGMLTTALEASSAIPCVFQPVRYNDCIFVDGGVKRRVPFMEVKEMGADVVIGVDVFCHTELKIDNLNNVISMMLRVFDVMDDENSKRYYDNNKNACDLYLKPDMADMSPYKLEKLDIAYQAGYDIAVQNMQRIKELIE